MFRRGIAAGRAGNGLKSTDVPPTLPPFTFGVIEVKTGKAARCVVTSPVAATTSDAMPQLPCHGRAANPKARIRQ